MRARRRLTAAAMIAATFATSACAPRPRQEQPQRLGLGQPITEAAVAPWNVDVAPDGTGLPEGSGRSQEGATIYAARCAECHDTPAFPQLWGGRGSLNKFPLKTVESYWPYATTLYDYIYRAMPPLRPQSLTPSQLYAVTAYVLASGGIIPRSEVIDARSLPKVIMPNRDGFVVNDGKPDT